MVKKVKKDDDCGTLQKEYFRSHGDDRTKAWKKMSFFCQPYTWVRHKLRKTHKMFRPDRTGCYVDSKNNVVCNDPNPTNKDIIWLTKEQSDYYKNPVLPDPSTAERKHSKTKTRHARAESKFVDDEYNQWAEYAESKSGDAGERNHLDELQWAENAESKSGHARNHLDELQWAENAESKSGWGERNHLDELQWAEYAETKRGDAGERNHFGEFPRAVHSETKRGHARKHSDEFHRAPSEPKFSGIDERKSSPKPVNIHIEKYGILHGMNPADKDIVIVDPAGSPFLNNNNRASGASETIYKYLERPYFPDALRKDFKSFDARYQEYTTKKGVVRVIHTVGPNGSALAPQIDFDKFMLSGLTQTYENVFKAFITCGVKTLRLLMVSGGIYSGNRDITKITYRAISNALKKLGPKDFAGLGDRNIEMCLFDDDPYVYEDHIAECNKAGLQCPAAGGRKTLKRRRSPRSSPPRSGRSRTRSRSRF